MLGFARFFLLLTVALAAASLVTYPAWLLVGLIAEQPVHRVMHRIAMLVALVGFLWLIRREGLANKQALGFALPRVRFIRQLCAGIAVGALIMVPLMAMLYQFDVRVPKPGFQWSAAAVGAVIASGLFSGLVVAFIEETFFRGALFTAVQRESGTALAIVLPSLLYAAVHFLAGRLRIPAEQVDWSSGFAVLAKLLEQYSEPLALLDSFLALFAVGVLLVLMRLRTHAVAFGIGMHAAWVCVIAFVRTTTQVNPQAGANWMVGSYDGVIGWAALGWIATAIATYLTIDAVTRGGRER